MTTNEPLNISDVPKQGRVMSSKGHDPTSKYPFETMSIGEFFEIPLGDHLSVVSIRGAMMAWMKLESSSGFKLVGRKVSLWDGEVYRVHKIADS